MTRSVIPMPGRSASVAALSNRRGLFQGDIIYRLAENSLVKISGLGWRCAGV
jgi:hypothetical protein